MGGLLELKVARVADIDVENWPVPSLGIIYGNIPFQPTKGFVTWYAVYSSPQFNSAGHTADDGVRKDNTLEFNIAKDTPEQKLMFDRAEDDAFIVLYQDGNGNYKVFGSPDLPVYFNFSHVSGSGADTRNGYQCRFFSSGPLNSWFYNGSITVPPAGDPPAVVKRANGDIVALLTAGQTLTLNSPFSVGFEID